MALAPSNRRSYESAQKRFLLFCQDANFSPTSVSEELLCGYVAFLAKEGLKHTSIKSYLSAVRYMEITLGLPDPFAVSMPRLEQVLKGIKVWQGRQGRNKPNQKLPISPEILRQMKSLWLPHERDPTFIMLWAACCICFFGFLRSGELTVPSQFGYDPATHLSIRDVAVDDHEHPTMVQLSLKSSKTNCNWKHTG